MRPIKFRGIDSVIGGWVYGSYCPSPGLELIFKEPGGHISVVEGTVGQFTGLLDRNGKEIYEGDVLDIDTEKHPVVVSWGNGGFYAASVSVHKPKYAKPLVATLLDDSPVRVIGNRFENPELVSG